MKKNERLIIEKFLVTEAGPNEVYRQSPFTAIDVEAFAKHYGVRVDRKRLRKALQNMRYYKFGLVAGDKPGVVLAQPTPGQLKSWQESAGRQLSTTRGRMGAAARFKNRRQQSKRPKKVDIAEHSSESLSALMLESFTALFARTRAELNDKIEKIIAICDS